MLNVSAFFLLSLTVLQLCCSSAMEVLLLEDHVQLVDTSPRSAYETLYELKLATRKGGMAIGLTHAFIGMTLELKSDRLTYELQEISRNINTTKAEITATNITEPCFANFSASIATVDVGTIQACRQNEALDTTLGSRLNELGTVQKNFESTISECEAMSNDSLDENSFLKCTNLDNVEINKILNEFRKQMIDTVEKGKIEATECIKDKVSALKTTVNSASMELKKCLDG